MARDPQELLGKIAAIPPLPAIASRILELADNENTSALELANVVSADQGLTSQLIKASHSSFYGFSRRVTTVREAIVLLGFKQVRQMSVSASIMKTFRQRSPDDLFNMDLFWGHSVVVAIISECLARATRAAKPEDAFTAGILHDIGRLVLYQELPLEFNKAMELAATSNIPLAEAELLVTGYAHDEVGRALGDLWRFPEHLVEALGAHHDDGLTIERHGVAGIVSLANRLSWHYGLFCGYDASAEIGGDGTIPPDLAKIEKLCGGMETVLDRALYFIEAASGTPGQWFSQAS